MRLSIEAVIIVAAHYVAVLFLEKGASPPRAYGRGGQSKPGPLRKLALDCAAKFGWT